MVGFVGTEGGFPSPAGAAGMASATVDAVGAVSVVHISGEIDMTTRDSVERVVTRTVEDRPAAVVIDLSGVTFIGSSGLQMLAETRSHAAANAVPLRLVASGPRVLRPLEITGMTTVFSVYASVAEAVSL